MQEVATLTFRDGVSDDEAVCIVRVSTSMIGLALSLRSDGDIEVALPVPTARALVSALGQALALAASDAEPGAAADGGA
jgi:hypothetical protein